MREPARRGKKKRQLTNRQMNSPRAFLARGMRRSALGCLASRGRLPLFQPPVLTLEHLFPVQIPEGAKSERTEQAEAVTKIAAKRRAQQAQREAATRKAELKTPKSPGKGSAEKTGLLRAEPRAEKGRPNLSAWCAWLVPLWVGTRATADSFGGGRILAADAFVLRRH